MCVLQHVLYIVHAVRCVWFPSFLPLFTHWTFDRKLKLVDTNIYSCNGGCFVRQNLFLLLYWWARPFLLTFSILQKGCWSFRYTFPGLASKQSDWYLGFKFGLYAVDAGGSSPNTCAPLRSTYRCLFTHPMDLKTRAPVSVFCRLDVPGWISHFLVTLEDVLPALSHTVAKVSPEKTCPSFSIQLYRA